MPFTSKAQMRAAFSGALGEEMKSKADEWAHETVNIRSLPNHVTKSHQVKRSRRDQLIDHLNRKR